MPSLDVLHKFDRTQLFRFFVDGRFHKKYKGWQGYENNEPGSVKGMLNGFLFMLDCFDLSSGVSARYIVELHKACMTNVQTKNSKSSPGDLRYLEAGFHFYSGQTTINSLAEIFAMRRGDNTPLFHAAGFEKSADELDIIETYEAIRNRKKLRFRPWYPELDPLTREALDKKGSLEDFYRAKSNVQMQFAARMEEIVSDFNRRITSAGSANDKILTIAGMIRKLELLHPFPDGNCRTFVNLLMNHLLLFHGFYPAILKDPNLDAELSNAEFALEILDGINNTRILLENPEEKLFNYSISEADEAEKKQFLALGHDFFARLEKMCGSAEQRGSNDGTGNDQAVYLNADNLVRITGGTWYNMQSGISFTGVGSHNTYKKGYLYFGLSFADWIREKKDIDAELEKVFKRGARAVVLNSLEYAEKITQPLLLVDDVERAFKEAAVAARKEVDCKTVLLTGTVGKTGCKVQLHHCLKGQTQVHATLNSANTRVPVLWSLANLKKTDRVEINEVSVGGGDSIGSSRSKMVCPDICLFTSIGPNHMDIHKTLDNLVKAKSSVVDGLREGGVCIVNSSDDLSADLMGAIRSRTGAPLFTFGTTGEDAGTLLAHGFDSQRYGWKVRAGIEGEEIEYFIPLFHHHAPLMSVGVLLTIKKLGYDFRRAALDYEGIDPFETMGRLYSIFTSDGSVLFYDQSRRGGIQGMRSAFEDIRNFNPRGKIVALLGGISVGQDNDWTRRSNAELAGLINDSRIERLYTTGKYMNYVHEALEDQSRLVMHSDDFNELAAEMMKELKAGDLLFIMGSAYLYLGRLANRILQKHSHERLR